MHLGAGLGLGRQALLLHNLTFSLYLYSSLPICLPLCAVRAVLYFSPLTISPLLCTCTSLPLPHLPLCSVPSLPSQVIPELTGTRKLKLQFRPVDSRRSGNRR